MIEMIMGDKKTLIKPCEISKLSSCCRELKRICAAVMGNIMREKLKESTNELKDIKRSFGGLLGIALAGENRANISSSDPFFYTLPIPNFNPAYWLRISLSNGVHGTHRAGDRTEWFLSGVWILKRPSMAPLWPNECPKFEVLICTDGHEEYDPCVVQQLQWTETEHPSECTQLRNNDRIIVLIEDANKNMVNASEKYPIKIKMIRQN